MERLRADVCVVGAGFAGLAAARSSSRERRSSCSKLAIGSAGGRGTGRCLTGCRSRSAAPGWGRPGSDVPVDGRRRRHVPAVQPGRPSGPARRHQRALHRLGGTEEYLVGLGGYALAVRRLSRWPTSAVERPWDADGADELDARTLAEWLNSRRNVPSRLGRELPGWRCRCCSAPTRPSCPCWAARPRPWRRRHQAGVRVLHGQRAHRDAPDRRWSRRRGRTHRRRAR